MKLSLGEEVSFNDITEKVKSLSLEGSCCMRYCGTQITTDASGKINIIAWQCNMADIQNYDVKLPTVIKMDLGADKTIKNIELMPNFKGSQGLACSRCYLDRRLRTILTGEKLTKPGLAPVTGPPQARWMAYLDGLNQKQYKAVMNGECEPEI